MGNVVTWKTIGKFILKSVFFFILLILAREGVFLLISCWGGGVTTNQRDIVPPPLFLTSLSKNQPHWPHTSFVHKNGFCFCFFSLGLGLRSRVRIKMWIMWNSTQPPLSTSVEPTTFPHWHSQTNKQTLRPSVSSCWRTFRGLFKT